MTTKVHTDITVGAPANASVINAPLGQIDAAVWDVGYNIREYGAITPTTDIGPYVNSAITDANAAGGGRVIFPIPPSTVGFQLATTIAPKSNVTLESAPGTVLKWVGATATNMMFASPASGSNLIGFNMKGLTLDANSVASVTPIFLNSWQYSVVEDLTLKNVSGAGVAALRMEVANGTTNVNNTVGNEIHRLTLQNVPVGIQLSGLSGNIPATNNRFYGTYMGDSTGTLGAMGTGIRFVQYCDSNQFYFTEILLSANNAYGVIFNDSATPAADMAVYNNNFYHLDVSGFSLTGLTGILMNVTKQIFITDFYHSPQVFNGTLINDNAGRAYSYYIVIGQDNSAVNTMNVIAKGLNFDTSDAATPIVTIANSVAFQSATAGNNPGVMAKGTDTNVSLALKGKGTGGTYLSSQQTNFGFFSGATTGNAPALQAIGNDTNVDLQLLPQGTGAIGVGAGGARLKVDNFGHLISDSTGTPTTGALGANVTSVTFTGNDIRGKIVIVMSGALAANTRIATCTWAHSFSPVTPIPLLSSETSGAGLAIVNFYSGAESATAFDLFCEQALATGTYTLRYIAIG